MKKTYAFIIALLISATLFAQAPQSFKYQAVLRDARGNTKANTSTSIIISILQGSATGTSVYSESHKVTTDGYGLINLEIGKGTVTLGTFSGINWGVGIYFIKVTVDGVEMGTSQLLSVPYALYANKAGNEFSGSYLDLTNKPILFDGTWSGLTGKPSFASVATSGSYLDLTNKPILFNGTWTSLTGKPTLSLVATTGSYTNLTNQPILTNGTVTSVTGTSPITVTTSTTTPIVSMVKASGTTNGYLSSTDWTKFNNTSSFDGTFGSLTGKPTTVAGYGITDAVATTGNQTIAGNKTFSGTTTVITPVNAIDAANKAYVDAKTSGSTNGHYVGELFGGGIVVAVWKVAGIEKGLIASLTDISTGIPWSNNTSTEIGVTAHNKIDGQPNTNAIISQSGHTSSAAKLCDDYTNTDTGTGIYSDWYLPSILELNQCFNASFVVNTILGVMNGFKFNTNDTYWSSTEYSNTNAYAIDFSYYVFCTVTGGDKGINLNLVRAVRKF